VTTTIGNLILGKIYVDHGGVMKVRNHTAGLTARLAFKEQGLLRSKDLHQVRRPETRKTLHPLAEGASMAWHVPGRGRHVMCTASGGALRCGGLMPGSGPLLRRHQTAHPARSLCPTILQWHVSACWSACLQIASMPQASVAGKTGSWHEPAECSQALAQS
jgi:Oxysterol-binding protein